MSKSIVFSVDCSQLASIVATSNEKYAMLIMTGHSYGYASATVHVYEHTDTAGVHNLLLDTKELTKEQITHLLSLDCPDAFIAYALTLCPCPPEAPFEVANKTTIPDTNSVISNPSVVDGGIPNYIEALKHINALVKAANEFAYDNSIINDDDHYELLEIELKIQQLITRDSIIEDAVCFDDIPPCFYSHPVNGSAMPFNLE